MKEGRPGLFTEWELSAAASLRICMSPLRLP